MDSNVTFSPARAWRPAVAARSALNVSHLIRCAHAHTLALSDSISGEREAPQDPSGDICQANLGGHQALDIEGLFKALGGSVSEREGSRVKIELEGEQWRCHRPHPGKEARRYQVEEARELLERVGVTP